jgi:hypothetical protein
MIFESADSTDQPIVRPNPSIPFPLLDDMWICFMNKRAYFGKELATPVIKFCDSFVYPFRFSDEEGCAREN